MKAKRKRRLVDFPAPVAETTTATRPKRTGQVAPWRPAEPPTRPNTGGKLGQGPDPKERAGPL